MKLYKSYSFRDKDPVIDQLRTLIKDLNISHLYIETHSGVTRRTLYAWFHGATRRPQHCTVAAVLACLGYEFGFVSAKGHNILPMRAKR